MKTISLKRIFIATLIVSVFSAAAAVEANQFEQTPAGFLSYTFNDETMFLEASATKSQTQSEGDLKQMTLTETFTNPTNKLIVAEYQVALPNPAALVNYEVSVDSDFGCEPSTADSLVITPGQSVTVTVTYNLLDTQLVSFHSTVPMLNAKEVIAPQVAATY